MTDLYPAKEFRLPVTAECISPDVFEGKTLPEIEKLKLWEGNKQRTLNELFKIKETGAENPSIAIHGDVSSVRRIGACMTKGEIVIEGNAGMHLGEEMRSGKINVHGHVAGWAGSMMKGGEIEVHGDAGDYLASPYRGSTMGMDGGRITVYGNVGSEVGNNMKKGMVKIYGNARQFVGFRMHDGTIYVQSACQGRAGACMVGGKIVVGGFLESVVPTFTIDSIRARVKVEEDEVVEGPLYMFLGDLTENGNGKLYVIKEKNPHLRHYEKYL
jgi:formylmethanofuran dehydrogenase subunit C